MMSSKRKKISAKRGYKVTGQRKAILQALAQSSDHPNVEELRKRVQKRNPKIGTATIYRTMRLFEEEGIVHKHEFGDGRARYEDIQGKHHDHLIDVKSGRIIEFENANVERLQKAIAKKLGFTLVGHRLELYGVPIKKKQV